MKTKIKTYSGNVITNFQGKKIPKENAACQCLSIIMLDFVIKATKKYYPQTFLEESKYEPKIQKWRTLLVMIQKKSESDESDSDSNDETESDDESNE